MTFLLASVAKCATLALVLSWATLAHRANRERSRARYRADVLRCVEQACERAHRAGVTAGVVMQRCLADGNRAPNAREAEARDRSMVAVHEAVDCVRRLVAEGDA